MSLPYSKEEFEKFFTLDKNWQERFYSTFPIIVLFQEKIDSLYTIKEEYSEIIKLVEDMEGYVVHAHSISEELDSGALYIHHKDLYGHEELIVALTRFMTRSNVFKNGALSSLSQMPDTYDTEYYFINPSNPMDPDWDEKDFPFFEDEISKDNSKKKAPNLFSEISISQCITFIFFLVVITLVIFSLS